MGAPKKDQGFYRDYGRYAGVGIQFAATIAIFGVGGYYLDQWLGTYPWFLIAGIFLGNAGGFIQLVYTFAPRRKDRRES